jgi:hypothetical protein
VVVVLAGHSSFQRPLACWVRRAMMSAAPSVVQCMPACLARWPTIALMPSFDGARAYEHARIMEVLVAHPVGVALEVAELPVQFLGLDAGERVAGGGIDDGCDVPGVQLLAALGEPLLRVGGDEGQVSG